MHHDNYNEIEVAEKIENTSKTNLRERKLVCLWYVFFFLKSRTPSQIISPETKLFIFKIASCLQLIVALINFCQKRKSSPKCAVDKPTRKYHVKSP